MGHNMAAHKTVNGLEAQSLQARGRLLDAAERLFAENGFEGTSVRQITALADCNVAAVNYHFGGKDKLYLEMFGHRMRQIRDIRLASIAKVMAEKGPDTPLEDLLQAFATAFLEPLVNESGGRRFLRLSVREMLDPHLPPDMFYTETVRPVMNAMLGAMTKIYPSLNEETALMSIQSIVAQLLHADCARQMIGHSAETALPLSDLHRAMDHIVAFSAAGIRAYLKEGD